MSVVSDRTLRDSITGAILAGNVVASGPFLDDSLLMKSDLRAPETTAPSYGWRIAAMNLLGPDQGRVRMAYASVTSIVPAGLLDRDIFAGGFPSGPRVARDERDLQTLIDDLCSGTTSCCARYGT